MRFYSFSNMYLSSIQTGIQSGHVIAEMAVKYQPPGEGFTQQGRMFYDWAENHKVMILLNGGYGENLHDLYAFIDQNEHLYPYAKFNESHEALDGALTSVGIVLPEGIYNGARAMQSIKRLRQNDPARIAWDARQVLEVEVNGRLESITYSDFEVELMTRLNSFRLAS